MTDTQQSFTGIHSHSTGDVSASGVKLSGRAWRTIWDGLKHRGYIGSVAIHDGSDMLHGEVLAIVGSYKYQGGTLPALREAFIDAVDRYLADCAKAGKEPDRPIGD